jgi:hypothetical protein
MSESVSDSNRRSLGLTLWSAATILLLLFVFGVSGLIHLALWVLVIFIIFGFGFAAVALIMRVLGG